MRWEIIQQTTNRIATIEQKPVNTLCCVFWSRVWVWRVLLSEFDGRIIRVYHVIRFKKYGPGLRMHIFNLDVPILLFIYIWILWILQTSVVIRLAPLTLFVGWWQTAARFRGRGYFNHGRQHREPPNLYVDQFYFRLYCRAFQSRTENPTFTECLHQ